MSSPEYDPLYLEGIELFNSGCYFASHEVWEELWHNDQGLSHRFYQGLIQAAVAIHHAQRGNAHGARKLLASSRKYLSPYTPEHRGLDVRAFMDDVAACLRPVSMADQECHVELIDASTVPKIVLTSTA